jgi:hypothetical protein
MDDVVVYSIEWLPKDDVNMCWNQHATTESKFMSRIYLFEAKCKNGFKKNNFRVRSL